MSRWVWQARYMCIPTLVGIDVFFKTDWATHHMTMIFCQNVVKWYKNTYDITKLISKKRSKNCCVLVRFSDKKCTIILSLFDCPHVLSSLHVGVSITSKTILTNGDDRTCAWCPHQTCCRSRPQQRNQTPSCPHTHPSTLSASPATTPAPWPPRSLPSPMVSASLPWASCLTVAAAMSASSMPSPPAWRCHHHRGQSPPGALLATPLQPCTATFGWGTELETGTAALLLLSSLWCSA